MPCFVAPNVVRTEAVFAVSAAIAAPVTKVASMAGGAELSIWTRRGPWSAYPSSGMSTTGGRSSSRTGRGAPCVLGSCYPRWGAHSGSFEPHEGKQDRVAARDREAFQLAPRPALPQQAPGCPDVWAPMEHAAPRSATS